MGVCRTADDGGDGDVLKGLQVGGEDCVEIEEDEREEGESQWAGWRNEGDGENGEGV